MMMEVFPPPVCGAPDCSDLGVKQCVIGNWVNGPWGLWASLQANLMGTQVFHWRGSPDLEPGCQPSAGGRGEGKQLTFWCRLLTSCSSCCCSSSSQPQALTWCPEYSFAFSATQTQPETSARRRPSTLPLPPLAEAGAPSLSPVASYTSYHSIIIPSCIWMFISLFPLRAGTGSFYL